MRVLITGSAGFIGFHLTKKLLERGDYVVGLDNINDHYDISLKYARLTELGIEEFSVIENCLIKSDIYSNHFFIKTDLENIEDLNKLLNEQRFDIVCHLAGIASVRNSIHTPHEYIHSNINGFLNILEGCKIHDIKNLIYASSSSVYGLNEQQPYMTTYNTDFPISLYAATKKSNELMAHVYAHQYGIKTTGLRFFTVYGPWGRPNMAPMLFADAIMNNRPIDVYNYGNIYRDFTYIDDVVEGIILSIDNSFSLITNGTDNIKARYQIYNIGSGISTSIMDFICALENAIGVKALKNFMPMQRGDVLSTLSDTMDTFRRFGYIAKTPLTEGIGLFIEWYKQWKIHH